MNSATDRLNSPDLETVYSPTGDTDRLIANYAAHLQQLAKVDPDPDKESERLFSTFVARDQLDDYLKRRDTLTPATMVKIARLDDHLIKLGHEVLMRADIDMVIVRHLRKTLNDESQPPLLSREHDRLSPKDAELGWWWYLEDRATPSQEDIYSIWQNVIPGAWTIAAIALLLWQLELIIGTASRVVTLVLQLFSNADFSAGGFDLINIAGIALQIAAGVRLVGVLVTDTSTATINNILRQFVRKIHWRFGYIFPISRFAVATVTFMLFVLISDNYLIPALGNALRDQVTQSLDMPSGSLNILEISYQLNPHEGDRSEYAVQLALFGIRYQSTHQLDDARRLYERALSIEPSLVQVRYRLADLYIDNNEHERALQILDEGIIQLKAYADSAVASPGFSNIQITQLQYLFLVSRARAFLKLDQPLLALINLGDAELIVQADRTLILEDPEQDYHGAFLHAENKDEQPDRIVPTVELYYLQAKANDQMFEETNADYYFEAASLAWAKVQNFARKNNSQEQQWLMEAYVRTQP